MGSQSHNNHIIHIYHMEKREIRNQEHKKAWLRYAASKL